MTVTGIIAEFNPFHHGHAYLLSQAQGLKVVVMSGNFMQRGEPAIIDKWTRTQMALAHGADIVLELPFLVAVQSADYFAKGAVDILEQVGIDHLTFGTEDVLDYNHLANLYQEKKAEMDLFISQLPKSLSYPQKAQAMWSAFAQIDFSGSSPNHILALAYTKAVAGKKIRLCPIKRLGAGFHDEHKADFMASATAIRQHQADLDFVNQAMPDPALFIQSAKVSWDNYFNLLCYQILTQDDLTQIYQVNEELASRLKKGVRKANNFTELLENLATKRYTKARLRRILTYILVNAREANLPDGLRLLGFSQAGRDHLSQLKKDIKLISRIGQTKWDPLSQQADQIYQLGHAEIVEQNWGQIPIYYH
ncbi:nucleotidyltransferase [Streptococcus sp. sy018]|uniref:nucleotidyltransferase n=1 Tax=Streptococcus sp. sy018 TaxID=2600147 RepID=UPI0011B7728B|nr:nucleotidyltransferase [Streptococcus sp. sy018]TWS94903.1 nucleotidyltransferase [Streptococcus sp. sy018]